MKMHCLFLLWTVTPVKEQIKKTAQGVDHSMVKLGHPDFKVLYASIKTGVGGGGVCIGLHNELVKYTRVNSHIKKHSCSLHGHNISFSNCTTQFFGSVGVNNVNPVQLFFTCYAIEKEFEIETFKTIWFRINGSTCVKCQVQLLLTRLKAYRWKLLSIR